MALCVGGHFNFLVEKESQEEKGNVDVCHGHETVTQIYLFLLSYIHFTDISLDHVICGLTLELREQSKMVQASV